ncbi:MAG: S8 family serine peptidase [Candidatus Neomarinimicrobiota bacterium]
MLKIYVDNSVLDFTIVGNLKTSDSQLNDVLQQQGAISIKKWLPKAESHHSHKGIYLDRYYVIEFYESKNNIKQSIDIFSNLDCIRIVEFVPVVNIDDRPNDQYWDQLYGLRQINADNAFTLWDFQNGDIPGSNPDKEIVVGVVDVGLMWDHPDLIDNIWRNLGEDADGDGDVLELVDGQWVLDSGDTNNIDDDGDGYVDNLIGYDVAYGDNNPYPTNTSMEHGTMVAGCVSAVTNNEIGISSVGWAVKLMGVNSSQNSSTISHGYEGILAAAQMGADIINLSWGMSSWFESHEAFINVIIDNYNCILVAAAGNYGVNEPHYPASYDNVISVTATSAGNKFNCWANFHETVNLSAPGEAILTTIPFSSSDEEMYRDVTGTSFSSPTVAGAFALLKSVFPHGDSQMLISRILNGTSYFDDMDDNCNGENLHGLLGEGQLNIHSSLIMDPFIEVIPLGVSAISYNGMVIPGDTVVIDVLLQNIPGSAPIENVVLNLTIDDSNIEIINNEYNHSNIISSGQEFIASFMIASNELVSFGEIACSLYVHSNVSANLPTGLEFIPQNQYLEVFLPVGHNQDGYPIENISINGEPLFVDLYGNSTPQIFFNSDSSIHGKWFSGIDVFGFPIHLQGRVTTTLSAGDLDADGDMELVFGTENGNMHIHNKDGSQYLVLSQLDTVVGHITLSDIDFSGNLNIVFVTRNDSLSTVHVVDLSGQYLEGFPFNLDFMVRNGVSVADLDLDGLMDIIVPSEEEKIHVIDAVGNPKLGFPIAFSSSLTTPVSVADMDSDQDLEMIMGLSDGDIVVLHHDGSIMNIFSSNSTIQGGISIADIDQNEKMELIFNSNDHTLHAWEPYGDRNLNGWPINLGHLSMSEPILVDLDNNLRLEVINVTINGDIHIINHDGTTFENFPYLSNDTTKYTPAIGDLDNDGDYEIILGTNSSLRVIDIMNSLGEQYSWNTYRGNSHRDGFFDASLSYLSKGNDIIPKTFYLSNNYPNPFNSSTIITFHLPKTMHAQLNIHDILGRKIKTLTNGLHFSGMSSVNWEGMDNLGRKVPSGIYFYEFRADDFVNVKKMIIVK